MSNTSYVAVSTLM